MVRTDHKPNSATSSSKHTTSVRHVDDLSYDFSRYLRLPGRRIILLGGILSGLVYVYLILQPQFLAVSSIFWSRGPRRIDGPTYRPEDSRCHPRNLCRPNVPGVKIVKIEAADVRNYSLSDNPLAGMLKQSYFAPSFGAMDFCNITVTYTHSGFNDEVHVTIHLPLKSNWNGRFQGTGGGGFAPGLGLISLFAPVSRGFAAASTDGGIPTGDASDWALTSDGNVDFNTLHTFGSTAVADMSVIGQQLTHSFYGRPANYSYWNGCSTGGRQGIQLAQSHPDLYDGILAAAPAIHAQKLATAMYWPQILMQEMQSWVQPCELEALTAAAIKTCDELDGVVDGIISAPEKCKAAFDPYKLVGASLPCPSQTPDLITISSTAAHLVSKIWSGPTTIDGYHLFPPFLHEANLAALAATSCSDSKLPDKGPTCRGLPQVLPAQWIQLFLLRKSFPYSTTVSGKMGQRHLTSPEGDPYADLRALTREDFDELFAMATREYTSFVGSDDPDLSRFAKLGGKMVTWHGLADDLIAPGGSIEYYESVLEHFQKFEKSYKKHSSKRDRLGAIWPLDKASRVGAAKANSVKHLTSNSTNSINQVMDFYRLYLAPGVSHCLGGVGPIPGSTWDSAGALDQLMAWVENGTVPDTLHAVSGENAKGVRIKRPLCTWPKIAKYRGAKGQEMEAEGWVCEDPE